MDDHSERRLDVFSGPSANEGQYFHDRDAMALIRALLAGNPPDRTASEAFGPIRDVIDNLRRAHEAGGTATVRRAMAGILRRNPALAAWAAAEATASPGWQVYTLADAYRSRPPLRYVSMPSPWLDAGRPDGMATLRKCIEATGATLVIIDNLTVVRGTVDENSPEMARLMAHFRQLVEDHHIALILIHHQRKATGTEARAGDRIRGHSSIEAALDVALLVERHPDADAVTVRITKARDVAITPFGAQFAYDHKPGTRELSTARFFALPAEDDRSDRTIEDAIIEAVRANPHLNQGHLKAQVQGHLPGVGLRRIGMVIDRLARQGALHTTRGSRGALLYDLPSRSN